tara:strand:- start:272 stop:1060 length:789 start_codon:yes stop_codon:yes gene_type:complete
MKDVKQNRLKEEKILNFLKNDEDLSWELSIFEEIGSTNDYLLENSKKNKISICLTESQTKGRGRNSKEWQSPKYENIYMSISFSTNQDLKFFSSFSLVTALSVQKALTKHKFDTKIKWPNDIYINSKKVGGILIETLSKDKNNIVVVGIGLNVFMKSNLKIDREWTSLILENESMSIDRNKIISDIANELLIDKKTFEERGFGVFSNEFNDLNILKNKKVFLSNSQYDDVVALDVNEDGSLNVKTKSEIKKIFSGEVSIRLN